MGPVGYGDTRSAAANGCRPEVVLNWARDIVEDRDFAAKIVSTLPSAYTYLHLAANTYRTAATAVVAYRSV
eukprot:scaffold123909_cov27-Prasinocladus_malaysianus.AAC.1